MSSEDGNHPKFQDPIIKRNYYLIFNYMMFLADSGLNFLKREYLNSIEKDNYIKQLSASSFFEFILRENIRNKIRDQIRIILGTAVLCSKFQKGKDINFEELDKIVEKKYPLYSKNDMTLLHTNSNHPAYQELKVISKLTFRIAIIQTTRIIAVQDENIKIYEDLIKGAYKSVLECRQSINAIFSMIDQMVDCFESNLDLIDIPVYKPTFSLRDFAYVPRVYEYALEVIDNLINKIYSLVK